MCKLVIKVVAQTSRVCVAIADGTGQPGAARCGGAAVLCGVGCQSGGPRVRRGTDAALPRDPRPHDRCAAGHQLDACTHSRECSESGCVGMRGFPGVNLLSCNTQRCGRMSSAAMQFVMRWSSWTGMMLRSATRSATCCVRHSARRSFACPRAGALSPSCSHCSRRWRVPVYESLSIHADSAMFHLCQCCQPTRATAAVDMWCYL